MTTEPEVDLRALRSAAPDLMTICQQYNCPVLNSQVDDALTALARGIFPHNAMTFVDKTHPGAAAVAAELEKLWAQQQPASAPETLVLLAFAAPVFDLLAAQDADLECSARTLAAVASLLLGEPLESALALVGDHPHAVQVREELVGLPDGPTFTAWLARRQVILRRYVRLKPDNPELDDPRPLARMFSDVFRGRDGCEAICQNLPTSDPWCELWL